MTDSYSYLAFSPYLNGTNDAKYQNYEGSTSDDCGYVDDSSVFGAYESSVSGWSMDYSKGYDCVLGDYYASMQEYEENQAAQESTQPQQSGTTDPTGQSGTTDPTGQSGTTDPTGQSGTTDPTGQSGTTDPTSNLSGEYSQEKLAQVQEILESKTKQYEFDLLAENLLGVVDTSNQNGWHAVGDVLLQTLTFGLYTPIKTAVSWHDSENMKDQIMNMSNEELAAFQVYFQQKTGQDLSETLMSASKFLYGKSLTLMDESSIIQLLGKIDESNEYLKSDDESDD